MTAKTLLLLCGTDIDDIERREIASGLSYLIENIEILGE